MRSLGKLAFAAPAILLLVLVGFGLAQDKQEPKPDPVVIDLSKLPPEVAKRLIEELAKQKAATGTTEKKAKSKGGERPTGGKKPASKPADKTKEPPAKPAEKEKEPEKK